jgi:fibronectin type 3 domain-containing protein
MRWFASRFFRRSPRAVRRKPLRCTYRPLLEDLEGRLLPANVLSYHNDAFNTGQNLSETALTPANVNAASFGKLFGTFVDGQVYAQPLYMSGVTIASGPNAGVHNVVYVATEHDSVFAIDADGGQVLWKDSFINPASGVTTVPSTDTSSSDLSPEIGITSTPIIDPSTNTLYLTAKTKEVIAGANHYIYRLHALDVSTGAEKFGAPLVIADTIWNGGSSYVYVSGPTVNGTGDGNINGVVPFNALRQLQRPGLTLSNGNLYLAFASHGDNGPYHGWILGYTAQTLQPTAVFNTTPNGEEGGIWQGGGQIAVDSQGNFYVETGNGSFDTTLNAGGFPTQGDYGDSFLRIALDPASSPTNQNINGWGLKVVDYFTPFNQAGLNSGDVDLGSQGPLLLPDSVGSAAHPHLLVGAGKEGRIYLVDRDNMGKFDPNTDHVVQELVGILDGAFGEPAYSNNTLYYANGYGGVADTFFVSNGTLSATPTSHTPDSYGYPGTTPSISANGSIDGIVWDLDRATNQLRAYDATSYATELYTSAQAANNRDQLGAVVKFTVPTIVNGKVYVGTSNSLVAYGLFAATTSPPNAPSGLTAKAITPTQINLAWTDNSSNESGFAIEQSTDGVNFTQVGAASVNATAFSVVNLQPSTTYTFRVRAFNSVGNSGYSNLATATTLANVGAGGLDFSQGFAGARSSLTLNGLSANIVSSALRLTDGGTAEAASAFSTSPLDITRFSTQFTFQLVDTTQPGADGFTFTIQGVGPTALGPLGGGLGYGPDLAGGTGGIPNSMAIKFDLFSNAGEGFDSTGLYTNGASPTLAGSIDLSGTGIDLHSQHVFNVAMTYDGTTLGVTIIDTTTQASASQSYAVNIPSLVGGNNAFVGFTAATGGLTEDQRILTWSYIPASAGPPAAPTNLSAAASSGTQVTLNWTDNSTNESAFLVERKTGVGGTYTQIGQTTAGVATFVDTGLATNTQYFYRVRATNAAGFSAYSNEASVTTPVPPVTPSGARTTLISSTEIDLAWQDNSNNEDGFKVFRKISSIGTFNLVATLPPNSTSYQDTGLTPGTQFDYHIQAFNLAGFSDFTGLSTATLTTAPTGVSALAAGNQITLSWIAPIGAATYNVYRSTAAGAEGSAPFLTGITSTSFTDSSLANGTIYYYQVSAVDVGGESVKSSQASAITLTASPSALIVTPENGQVFLHWTAPTGAASYNLYRGGVSGAEGTIPVLTGITNPFVTDFGLTDGNSYFYQVTAVNAAGESTKSNEASATPLAPPKNLSAVGGAGQVTLNWTASPGDTTYNLYRGTSPGAENATPVKTGLTGTSFVDAGLSSGTTYYYQVTGANSGGESGKSNESSAITTPSAPGSLIAAPGPLQVSISWNASAGAATYNVYRSTASGAEGATPFKTGLTNTTFTDTGLTNGTTYYYQVTAVNAAGESSKSLETSATAQTSGLNFGSGFSGAGSLLALNGSTKLSGAALQLTDGGTAEAASAFSNTRFDVTRFATQFTFQVLNTTNPSADGFTFAIQGAGPTALGPGGGGLGFGPDSPGNGVGIPNSVAIKFDLYNNAGEGNDSTGLYTNGAAPTNVGSIDLTSTGIDLHSQHVFNVSMTYDGTTLKVTITDATTNASAAQSYTVNIPAIVGATTGYVGFTAGTGGLTASQSILSWTYTPSAAPPGAPAGLTAVPSANQVSLSWTPSPGATSYNIYRSTTSGGEGITPYRTGATGTSFVDTGVASGGTYYYQVSAVGAGGESTKSAETSATLVPATPTNLTSTASASQATLTWTPSAGATSYRVYRSTVSGGEGSTPVKTGLTSASFTDTGLTANTTYYYQVTAVNAAGESARSAEIAVVIPKPGLNFSNGFAGAGAQLTLNRSAKINGSSLQLTDGGTGEAASAFSTNTFDVTRFTTQFNFQLLNAVADGFTFAIQGVAATAVGVGGGGLGYAGLAKSVAVKFDLYNNAGEGTSSTGLYTNGATPTNVGSINLIPAGINLRSGHLFSASILYDGTTLKVTITDTNLNVSASQSYAVNIPAIVGSNAAFVGFTAGTGGLSANQNIRSWTYQPQ